MKISRVSIQSIGGVSLLFMVLALVWMMMHERPLAIVHCADGSILRIEAVTRGTNHVWKTKFPPYTDRSPWRRAWLAARDTVRPASKRLRKTVPFNIPTPVPCMMFWGHTRGRQPQQLQFSILDQNGRTLDAFHNTNNPVSTYGAGAGPIYVTTNVFGSQPMRFLIRDGTNSLAEFDF